MIGAANLLPIDGIAEYYGKIMTDAQADRYLGKLLSTIQWKHDEVKIFGKKIITSREVAWYGDSPFAYTYSKNTKEALPWTTELLELKQMAEEISSASFNSCLLNLYHSGEEGMGWHSDDEQTMGKGTAIASLSLGAERKFSFRHKTEDYSVSLNLENGSLLLMRGETQAHWKHALPKMKKVFSPRVNLTFRTFVSQDY